MSPGPSTRRSGDRRRARCPPRREPVRRRRAALRRRADPTTVALPTTRAESPERQRASGSQYRGQGRSSSIDKMDLPSRFAMLALQVSSVPPRDTPMLRQYFEMKRRVPDAILFYRMGDFYEMFFEDAKEAAPVLGIALTARHKDSDIEAPMCGVPYHAADNYIAKLIASGRKVAVCDQVEDARAARGLVRRDITRIVTPGTVLDPDSLEPGAPSYLAVLLPAEPDWEVAFLDLSTGQFHAGTVGPSRLSDVCALFRPREIL